MRLFDNRSIFRLSFMELKLGAAKNKRLTSSKDIDFQIFRLFSFQHKTLNFFLLICYTFTFCCSKASATYCSLDRMKKFAMEACEHLFDIETDIRERRSIDYDIRDHRYYSHCKWILSLIFGFTISSFSFVLYRSKQMTQKKLHTYVLVCM